MRLETRNLKLDPRPSTLDSRQNYCVIVPAYQEEGRIGRVVEGIRKYCDHVVVIDDASTDGTSEEAKEAGAVLIRHGANMGQGASLNSGFKYAGKRAFDFVITMDADGQHDPDDIPAFVEAYARTGTAVLVGNRMGDPGTMPLVRRLTNRFMSWLLSRKMNQYVPDTQCGFRLYARDVIPFIFAESQRYDAQSEVLLHLAERDIRIGAVPIKVIYGDEKSKINPFKDTIRFFTMLKKYERRGLLPKSNPTSPRSATVRKTL